MTGSSPVVTHNLAFSRDAIGLVVRRLPQPLPGTGAIAEYAELGNFGMRVTMSYQPNTLAQQFTVDVLYGVGRAAERVRRPGQQLKAEQQGTGRSERGRCARPKPNGFARLLPKNSKD